MRDRSPEALASQLKHLAAEINADIRWNWPTMPEDEWANNPGFSIMARQDPKMQTALARRDLFLYLAEMIENGRMP